LFDYIPKPVIPNFENNSKINLSNLERKNNLSIEYFREEKPFGILVREALEAF